MAKPVDPQCSAFQAAIEVLGRPWNGLLLSILQGGPLRFTELRERARGQGATVTDKILSARLKELEAKRLIERRVEPGPPVRVAYQLAERGRAFGEVARAIERWGRELTGEARRTRRRAAG
jgi:DNA-binding HxlR family transcriptional regulator